MWIIDPNQPDPREWLSLLDGELQVAVEFNDKYDASDHTLDLHALDRDLCKLGEELAVRIEMEDRIIQALTSR